MKDVHTEEGGQYDQGEVLFGIRKYQLVVKKVLGPTLLLRVAVLFFSGAYIMSHAVFPTRHPQLSGVPHVGWPPPEWRASASTPIGKISKLSRQLSSSKLGFSRIRNSILGSMVLRHCKSFSTP